MAKKINAKKLYASMATIYDKRPSVIHVLEEKSLPKMMGKIKGKSILDLGAGTGRWSVRLAKKKANITSVEESGGMLNILKKKIKLNKLDNIIFITRFQT